MNLRPYKKEDAAKILSWIKDAFLFHNEKCNCAEMVLDEQL